MEAEGVGHNATTYEHRVALHMMSGEPQGAFVVYRECKDAELAPPQARDSRETAEMRPRCSRDAAEVQPRCS